MEKIIAGQKKFKLRKLRCRDGIDTIVIYATSPTKKLVGEVRLLNVIKDDVEDVGKKPMTLAGSRRRTITQISFYATYKAVIDSIQYMSYDQLTN